MCGALASAENAKQKKILDRIAAMLTKLGQRGYSVGEASNYRNRDKAESDCVTESDPDSDPDSDCITGKTAMCNKNTLS